MGKTFFGQGFSNLDKPPRVYVKPVRQTSRGVSHPIPLSSWPGGWTHSLWRCLRLTADLVPNTASSGLHMLSTCPGIVTMSGISNADGWWVLVVDHGCGSAPVPRTHMLLSIHYPSFFMKSDQSPTAAVKFSYKATYAK